MTKPMKRVLALLVVIATLHIGGVHASAVQKGKLASVTVLSVDVVEKVLALGERHVLPATIKVNLSNGKTQQVAVLWSKASINTAKAGSSSYTGTLKGYGNKVTYVVKVLGIKDQIKNIPTTIVTVEKDHMGFQPPTSVKAIMKDNSTRMVSVAWKYNLMRTTKLGSITYEGSVENYKGKARLTVKVIPPKPNYSDLQFYTPEGWELPAMTSITKGAVAFCEHFENSDEVYVNLAIVNKGISETMIAPELAVLVDGLSVKTFQYHKKLKPKETAVLKDLPIGRLSPGEHVIEVRINNLLFDDDLREALDPREKDMTNNTFSLKVTVDCRVELSKDYFVDQTGLYKMRIPSGWYTDSRKMEPAEENATFSVSTIALKSGDLSGNIINVASFEGSISFDDENVTVFHDEIIQRTLTATSKVTETNREKLNIGGKNAYLIEFVFEDVEKEHTVSQKCAMLYAASEDNYYLAIAYGTINGKGDYMDLVKQALKTFEPTN